MDGFSGDGDIRLLNCMWHCQNNSSLNFETTVCYLQDIVHIATKFRNRLLNLLIALVIGFKVASVSHLKMILHSVPKDVHGLVYSDICPDDRQNFESLKKIMEPKVRRALAENIIDSEATIEYIKICDDITASLYDDELLPLDRLFRLSRSKCFLRAWRIFVTKTHGLNLSTNFITTNAYACVELNADNLIILIKKFRNENLDELFLPTIFNSQPCEQFFRKMRSMGTINYTKINFTLLELIHLVGRVELMNDIMYLKLADVDVCFPRDPLNKKSTHKFKLPTDEEIEETLARASIAAMSDAAKFGIFVTADEIADCQMKNIEIDLNTDDDVINDEIVDLGIASDENDKPSNCRNLKDHPEHRDLLDEGSSFVNVNDIRGMKTVRKSSLMTNLSSSKNRLSSDRIKRVKGYTKKSSHRQLEFVDVSAIDKPIYKSEEIKIGDWCILENPYEVDDDATNFILGNIISFQYASKSKAYKDRKYTWDFASTLNEENDSRKIEILSSWYRIDINGQIHLFDFPRCTFISINHYIANLVKHAIEGNDGEKIRISQKYLSSVQNMLKDF